MTATKILLLLFALACCFADKVAQAQSENEEYVDCPYNKPFCSCQEDRKVCKFRLTIREAQTFTRYVVEKDVRTTAGSVWYIDQETGELEPANQNRLFCRNETAMNCTNPITVDGYTFRSVITVNEQFPGPALRVRVNQIVSVEVTNLLASEEVTVHWHGMHQVKTHWMDGVHHVSQCGIAPGTTFQYIFRAWPAGTHWYHSHTGAQRTDGLFGALIVTEDSDTINTVESKISPFMDIPENHTMTLLDWQQKSSIDLFTLIHSGIPYYTDVTPPTMSPMGPTSSVDGGEVGAVTFWSGLINGKGRHLDVNYTKSRLSIFDVDYSNTYRFRVIGAQSLYAFRLSIDGHKLKVIATDGHFVNPVDVDFLIVHSGERYDFLLETKNSSEPMQNFMIRGETLEENNTNHTAEAILHYNSLEPQPQSPDYEEIESNSPRKSDECEANLNMNCTALNCPFENYPPSYGIRCIHVDKLTLLNPLPEDSNLPNYESEQQIFLNFGFEGASQTSSINSVNFKGPSSPLSLLNDKDFSEIENKERCKEIESCDTNPTGLLKESCFCMHMVDVPYNKSIQMVFSATGPDPNDLTNFLNAHPVHLHGHSFHVVEIGFGGYNEVGKLESSSEDIECIGEFTCVTGRWRNDPLQGLTGKIPNNAPLKDTVLLPAGGYVVVYIQSNNPGFWFLHCHIEVHQLEGMSMIINEGFDWRNPPPSDIRECGDFSWSIDEFKSKEAFVGPTEASPTTPTTATSPTNGASYLYSNSIIILVLLTIALQNF